MKPLTRARMRPGESRRLTHKGFTALHAKPAAFNTHRRKFPARPEIVLQLGDHAGVELDDAFRQKCAQSVADLLRCQSLRLAEAYGLALYHRQRREFLLMRAAVPIDGIRPDELAGQGKAWRLLPRHKPRNKLHLPNPLGGLVRELHGNVIIRFR